MIRVLHLFREKLPPNIFNFDDLHSHQILKLRGTWRMTTPCKIPKFLISNFIYKGSDLYINAETLLEYSENDRFGDVTYTYILNINKLIEIVPLPPQFQRLNHV